VGIAAAVTLAPDRGLGIAATPPIATGCRVRKLS
jgi:hypothetical protein